MSPTLPALARDDEKVEEEKETFGNTSGPQAAHSWTSVMLREKNSAQELHLVWHLHLPQLRFKSQAQFISAELFHILQSKWFHWFTIVCIHSRREAHVSCFASKKTPVPPLPSNCGPSPPAVGAILVRVKHPGDHLLPRQNRDEVYRHDLDTQLPSLQSFFKYRD